VSKLAYINNLAPETDPGLPLFSIYISSIPG
jgi:hypothetical protein